MCIEWFQKQKLKPSAQRSRKILDNQSRSIDVFSCDLGLGLSMPSVWSFYCLRFSSLQQLAVVRYSQPRPQGYNFFSLFWRFDDRAQKVFFLFLFLQFWVTGPFNVPFATLNSREPPMGVHGSLCLRERTLWSRGCTTVKYNWLWKIVVDSF